MRTIILALGALSCLAALPARADDVTLSGNRLIITLSGSNDQIIRTDPSLHGTVRIATENANCVSTHEEGGTILIENRDCGGDDSGMTVTMPRDVSLILTSSGSGNVTLGDIDAPLVVTLSGSGDLTAGDTGQLTLTASGSAGASVRTIHGDAAMVFAGSGDAKIGAINGALHTQISNSTDLVIERAESNAADIDMHGSGDVVIGKGHIGSLRANLNGHGDLSVDAVVGSAYLNASGGGDIRVARVTGQVFRNSSGGSTIDTHAEGSAGLALSQAAPEIAVAFGDTSSRRHDTGGSTFHHVLAGAFVLFILFMLWRMLQRRGGIPAVRARMNAAPAAPSHPGVLALRDTLTRLEGRLARVEGYVTEREFDLHRKFRDLEAGR